MGRLRPKDFVEVTERIKILEAQSEECGLTAQNQQCQKPRAENPCSARNDNALNYYIS
jgi:hypothetical protein